MSNGQGSRDQGVLKALKRAAKERFDPGIKLDQPSAIVGYTASYALFVHESGSEKLTPVAGADRKRGRDVKGRFTKGPKQSKYLEQPARELANSGELARIVRKAAKRRVKLGKALVLAGLRIQQDSQEIVPIETGNLKGSAFTREE